MIMMPLTVENVCAVVFGTAIVLIAGLLWKRISDRYNRENPPLKWKRVGQVSGLTIYPLKSGHGMSVRTAQCDTMGLIDVENPHLHLQDRKFIVYNSKKNTAVTGLVDPRMVLMEAHGDVGNTVRLSFPGQQDFLLYLSSIDTSKIVLLNRWWGETVAAVDCGNGVACWLSQTLYSNADLRLGYFSRPTVPLRTVSHGWTQFAKLYTRLRSEYLGAYSYLASYLIITKESMDDINSRLDQPVSERCYRANIIVKGSPAYCEDDWDWLRLGDSVIMRGFKPCTRCAVTAIDPDTGKFNPHFEPLRTLKRYRQLKSKEERELSGSEPVFGLYAGLHIPGIVRVGDPVYIGTSAK
ncbi:mitochondrial amidoxime-reducing component 1-like isoform X1 [Homalodisca vitripennis]|uniref:mitochondrial amidoxime-reducing component 1-like isoform X1 n=2 Tax=Homalodisca vitripennis TaxID=197043 RepID=UPI001EEBAC18|nr:mitochondrial amidoxime-reducing component 1-like isoform X1 [Homalodisca vitripennis]